MLRRPLTTIARALPRHTHSHLQNRHFSSSSSLWIPQRPLNELNEQQLIARAEAALNATASSNAKLEGETTGEVKSEAVEEKDKEEKQDAEKKDVEKDIDTSDLQTQLDASPSSPSSSSPSTASSSFSNSFDHAPEPKGRVDEGTSAKSAPAFDIEEVKKHLQEWAAKATILLREKADDFTEATKKNFAQLGAQLNHVTGYEEIEALKRGVVEQEHRISIARKASREAKTAFEEAAMQRANSQREVNDLLQRKSSWTDGDVGRFTSLVRQDHLYEQEEQRAKARVEETEEAVEREFSALMRKILARYHEEQVWSDKIRSASTYGSMAALGLNMLVFIIAIVAVEPWKRRRLAQTFERKIEELSKENEVRLAESMGAIREQIDQQRMLLENIREETAKKQQEQVVVPLPMPTLPQEIVTVEVPKPVEDVVTIYNWTIPRQQLEMAAVGAGAFAVGIISNLVFGR